VIAFSSISAFAAPHIDFIPATIPWSAEDPVISIKSYARDSTTYSNDRKVISLFGDAKVVSEHITVVADEIIYDASAQTLKIKNLHSLQYKDQEEKGNFEGTSLTLKLVARGYKVVK